MATEDWIKLCTAVGINVRDLDEADVYMLGGNIMRDRQLKDLVRFGMLDTLGQIKALTFEERGVLRRRVCGQPNVAYLRHANV